MWPDGAGWFSMTGAFKLQLRLESPGCMKPTQRRWGQIATLPAQDQRSKSHLFRHHRHHHHHHHHHHHQPYHHHQWWKIFRFKKCRDWFVDKGTLYDTQNNCLVNCQNFVILKDLMGLPGDKSSLMTVDQSGIWPVSLLSILASPVRYPRFLIEWIYWWIKSGKFQHFETNFFFKSLCQFHEYY